jgi:dTDP-4-amino-4,6-dideoxygalactose transaminase
MKEYMGKEELEALKEVIGGQQLWRGLKGTYAGGEYVNKFEEAVGKHFSRKYAYAVNSGTSANEAAVAGLGPEPGDEIICPAITPVFTAMSILAAGCIPVFSEVDPETLIIDPEEIEEKISAKTRAIYIVHLWGQPARIEEIMDIAKKHDLKVIEDCAQSYNCYYKDKKVGSFGDVAIFSLQQSKHITSGEGGFLITDDAEIYKRAVLYSNCGMPWFGYGLEVPEPQFIAGYMPRGHHSFGHNHRMGELQAAVAFAQLPKLNRFNEKRNELVRVIKEELRDCPGILLAQSYQQTEPNYWGYPLQIDPIKTKLSAYGVYKLCLEEEGVILDYFNDTVCYLEPFFQKLQKDKKTFFGYRLPDYVNYRPGSCPKAEEAAKRTLRIWTHHGKELEEIRNEVLALKKTMMRQLK